MTISIINPMTTDDRGGDGPQILLVSPDLLSTSRIAGLAREAGSWPSDRTSPRIVSIRHAQRGPTPR